MSRYKLPAAFLSSVAAHFPSDFLVQEPSELLEYGRDWTRAFVPAPSAVALPRSTQEVVELLRLCQRHAVPVVPSGGRTGLAGGAVAARGELVLSLARMQRIAAVDALAQTVRVQAGAVTQAVHQCGAEHGLTWPIDLAAKGSCQIGGNIATNAGGVRVIRYGPTRQWVLGLQVVTAAGEVLELNGALEKNNTGYDLRQLFIGSEGTLGVITEATLKLTRLPAQVAVLLFSVDDLAAVLRLFRAARATPFTIMAYEFMTARCLQLVLLQRGLRSPLPHDEGAGGMAPGHGTAGLCYVLLEIERPPGAADAAVDDFLQQAVEQGLVRDGVLAQSARAAQELWALREGISESLSRTGLLHKNDVALPLAELAPFCHRLEEFFAAKYPAWEIYVFGHIGDGNLHINVRKPDQLAADDFWRRTKEVDHDLFGLVQVHHGSISAEHGIGLLKKDYLSYCRSAAEIALLHAIKRALDPQGLLNPGKIFDL